MSFWYCTLLAKYTANCQPDPRRWISNIHVFGIGIRDTQTKCGYSNVLKSKFFFMAISYDRRKIAYSFMKLQNGRVLLVNPKKIKKKMIWTTMAPITYYYYLKICRNNCGDRACFLWILCRFSLYLSLCLFLFHTDFLCANSK